MCECREGIIEKYDDDGDKKIGEESTNLFVHDCGYIRLRNALIPKAERLAIQAVGLDDKGKPNSGFSRAFTGIMNELARESGVCK